MNRKKPLRAKPEVVREWEQRCRDRQIEAQKGARRARIKAKRKSAREREAHIARVYGSEARLRAIKAMRCAACGSLPSENHHIKGGCMGRKAGWRYVVPLCREHHDEYHNEHGSPESFDRAHGTDLRALAARLAEEMQP